MKIRNLPEDLQRALRQLAAAHGRSVKAKIRANLDAAMKPSEPVKLGSMLMAIGRDFGGVDLKVKRDQAPAEPASFE